MNAVYFLALVSRCFPLFDSSLYYGGILNAHSEKSISHLVLHQVILVKYIYWRVLHLEIFQNSQQGHNK